MTRLPREELKPGDAVLVQWGLDEVEGRFVAHTGLPGRRQAQVEVVVEGRATTIRVPLDAVRPAVRPNGTPSSAEAGVEGEEEVAPSALMAPSEAERETSQEPAQKAARAVARTFHLREPPPAWVGWATIVAAGVALIGLPIAVASLWVAGRPSSETETRASSTPGPNSGTPTTTAAPGVTTPTVGGPTIALEGGDILRVRRANSGDEFEDALLAKEGEELELRIRAHNSQAEPIRDVPVTFSVGTGRATSHTVLATLGGGTQPGSIATTSDTAVIRFGGRKRLRLRYVPNSTRLVEVYGHDPRCPQPSEPRRLPEPTVESGSRIPIVGTPDPDSPCSEVIAFVSITVRVVP